MIGETTVHASPTVEDKVPAADREPAAEDAKPVSGDSGDAQPREHGGRDGPDPTRYGDWEKNGRCIDF